MGGFLSIKVTQRKNGEERAWFRDVSMRRVGTSTAMQAGGGASWVKADQLKRIAQYGVELQQEQLDAGLGSDGTPMPPLKVQGRPHLTFLRRQNGRSEWLREPYPDWKASHGLKPIRDLRGPGEESTYYSRLSPRALSLFRRAGVPPPPAVLKKIPAGHMRDDIRVIYVDDQRAKIGITVEGSRRKALANERRAPWWGWSPASVDKLRDFAADVFNIGLGEYLVEVGLTSANFMVELAKKLNLGRTAFRRAR